MMKKPIALYSQCNTCPVKTATKS